MAQTVVIPNGVPILKLEEIVIGSQFNFAVQFERRISENPDVFEPLDFTGMTLEAHIKDKPSKEVAPDAEFVCVPRVTGDGWVDLILDGTATGLLEEHEYQSSLKVWPDGFAEKGDTLLVLILPMKFKATR